MKRLFAAMTAALLMVSLVSSGALAATSGTNVLVQGTLYGFLPSPCSCTVPVYLSAHTSGPAGTLTGAGVTHSATGPTYRFDLSGATNGSTVTLSGTIFKSTASFLIGTPVSITADASTGQATYTLGPLAGGVFVGQTLVFSGVGVIRIVPAQ